MTVDVHKLAAYRRAKAAAEKAEQARDVARLARTQQEQGDRTGAAWSQLLALMMQHDVDLELEVIRALRGEAA